MDRYIKGLFLKVYRYYTKDGFIDGEFSACFISAVLIASTLNLLNAVVFNLTQIDALKFKTSTVGVFLLFVIGVLTLYFSFNKSRLLDASDNEYTKTEHQLMNGILLIV